MCLTRFSRYLYPLPPCILPWFTSPVAVLSGNHSLEAPFPPQRLAVVGGFVLCGSLLLSHSLRLDAKWECDGICQVQSGRKPFGAGESTRCFPNSVLSVLDGPQLSGVMSGASYLHDLGVVHGDLKGVRFGNLHLGFFLADHLNRRISSSMTMAPLSLRTLVFPQFRLTSIRSPCPQPLLPLWVRSLGRAPSYCSDGTAHQLRSQTVMRSEWSSMRWAGYNHRCVLPLTRN